jgi:hypothetical protein
MGTAAILVLAAPAGQIAAAIATVRGFVIIGTAAARSGACG